MLIRYGNDNGSWIYLFSYLIFENYIESNNTNH